MILLRNFFEGTSLMNQWYSGLFRYLSQNRLRQGDLDVNLIHYLTAMVLSTGVLIWGYTFISIFEIGHIAPSIVGIICSVVLSLLPLSYRITNRHFLICNIALVIALIHQSVFAYFTGGFTGTGIMWFASLPMLAGIMCGRKGAVTWGWIGALVTGLFAVSHFTLDVPNYLSQKGFVMSLFLLRFGWVFLITIMILVHVKMKETSEQILSAHSQKIDDLFRVLFHDLANSLGRMSIGLTIARKNENHPQTDRGIEIASAASQSMFDITKNVRKMYAVSKGKAEFDLALTSLNSSIEYIQKIFASDLEKKNIRVNYNFENHAGLNLMVEPVSFNNQVLGNIISNAIKFSPPESVIDIRAYRDQNNLYAIEITDQGIGMPQNLMEQIFDISKKTSRPGTQGEAGTGFGMHIMKSFVEMYQGEVSLQSIETSGTTIKLLLKGEW